MNLQEIDLEPLGFLEFSEVLFMLSAGKIMSSGIDSLTFIRYSCKKGGSRR